MPSPKVAVIFGSTNDLDLARESKFSELFKVLHVEYEVSVASAHRNLEALTLYCQRLQGSGVRVFIAAAGLSAALPGTIAAAVQFKIPVIGVPLPGGFLGGLDAALAILQMPSGVPVALAGSIGKFGLYNAALIACQILATVYPDIQTSLAHYLDIQRLAKAAQFNLQLTQ